MATRKRVVAAEGEILKDAREVTTIEERWNIIGDGKPPLKRLPRNARMRRLSVEEAAALQTFPQDLDWQGPRSSRYRQVGNAVPPVLAWRVAELLRSVLDRR